jgi:hypothetical protein
MATPPPMPRTVVDELVDMYRSRPHGVPVIDAVTDDKIDEYYDAVDTVDRSPPPSRVIIIADENGGESVSFTTVPNDPILNKVGLRYAALMSNPNLSHADRRAYQNKIIADIVKEKNQVAPPSAPPLNVHRSSIPSVPVRDPSTTTEPEPAARPAKMWVTFSIPGAGSHRAAYDHVQISNVTLLMASRIDDTMGYYTPPIIPTDVMVDGMSVPVRAIYLDTFQFNGYAQIVMIIDRSGS